MIALLHKYVDGRDADLSPGSPDVSLVLDALTVLWTFAAGGAVWVEAVLFGPRLMEAGHTPEQAETILARVPAWRSTPVDAVTALVALWTLFRLYKARFGPAKEHDFRARAAEAGRAWVVHRST